MICFFISIGKQYMDDVEISYTKCHVLNLYQKITEEERMVDTKKEQEREELHRAIWAII